MAERPIGRAGDAGLMARVAAGDAEAFATLYERYSPLAYAVALRICAEPADAEDVVAEAFIKVWRGAGRYAAERGGLGAWVATIARNQALDALRRHRVRPTAELLPHASLEAPDWAARLDLRGGLSQLEPRQGAVLYLYYFGGLSQREIAERMDASVAAVKSLARRGLDAMRGSVAI